MSVHSEDDMAKVIYRVAAEAGRAGHSSPSAVPSTPPASVPPRELIDRCERTLDRTHEEGVEHAVRRPGRLAG